MPKYRERGTPPNGKKIKDYEDVPSDEELAVDEALWDKQFAESKDFLDKLADEICTKYDAGQVEDFDPETDPDLSPCDTPMGLDRHSRRL